MNDFQKFGLEAEILRAVVELGFDTPTPVQAESIPLLLAGKDLLAQAQTGTGKTAAFGLPILSKLDLSIRRPQALILAPTRELAIQVAEALVSFAKFKGQLQVLAIYGGSDYRGQLKGLKAGVHVVVGTPGRVMDHMRRGTLNLGSLTTLILDEADEMLNMGFIEDIEWILQQIPKQHQTALFSATIPNTIKQIANQYLRDASHVKIHSQTKTLISTQQHYVIVQQKQKYAALCRFLAMNHHDGVIVFTQTKHSSSELADRLIADGYSAAAINGDLSQDRREKVINQIKQSKIDIVVATDVAARGIDVQRISHVINYDIPTDSDTYTHRIGRTGRAGRTGTAIMLVTPKERYIIGRIERDTRQEILAIEPPTFKQVQEQRQQDFANKIITTLKNEDLNDLCNLIQSIATQNNCSELQVGAAIAHLSKLTKPLTQSKDSDRDENFHQERSESEPRNRRSTSKEGKFKQRRNDSNPRKQRATSKDGKFQKRRNDNEPRKQRTESKEGKFHKPRSGDSEPRKQRLSDSEMVSCRMDIGHDHGVTPGDIVGVIANKAQIHRKHIGKIAIYDGYSLVDLDKKYVTQVLDSTRLCKLKGKAILNTRTS